MSKPIPTSARRERVRNFVPKLIETSEEVLYGDIWERADLSKRDRSLVTVAALIALGKTEQLKVHAGRALDNGVSETELSETITHLAFYAGWPAGMMAADVVVAALSERAGAK